MKRLLLATLLAFPAACSCGSEPPPGPPAISSEEMVRQMYAVVDEQKARPELELPEVTIQHVLIGVNGGGAAGANKSPGEAEALVAELYTRAKGGEDFDLLVKNYTNDTHPGIYRLVTSGGDGRNSYDRDKMWPCFGDVAWRLAVGELGVAVYDGGLPGAKKKSPLGFHLIKRLK